MTRTIRDDPTKVKHLTTRVTWRDVVDCFTDRYVWAHLAITFVGLTPLTPLQTYLPSVIKAFDYNVFVANALTAPVYVAQCIFSVLMGWHTSRKGHRWAHGVFGATWLLVGCPSPSLLFRVDLVDLVCAQSSSSARSRRTRARASSTLAPLSPAAGP